MSVFRRSLILLLLGIASIFFQGSVLKMISPELLVPNLLILIVVYLGFHQANSFGAVMSFLIGLEYDLYSGILLGPWAGAFVVVFTVLALLSPRVFVESGLVIFLAVLLSSLAACLLFMLLSSQFNPVLSSGISISFKEAFFTAIFGPIVFKIFRKIRSSRQGYSRGTAEGGRL